MANKKITDLPAGVRMRADDLIEVVQAGPTSKQISLEEIAPGPDMPPAVADPTDDEFDGSVLDAKWSWLNQGSASVIMGASRAVLLAPGVSGNNLRGLEQTIGAGPWEYNMKLTPEWGAAVPTNAIMGMMLRQSSTNRLMVFGYQNGNIMISWFTNPTLYNGQPHAIGQNLGTMFLKIQDNLTNLIFKYSRDGAYYHTFWTDSRTAFLTGAADRIGFAADSEQGGTSVATSVDWIRRTA